MRAITGIFVIPAKDLDSKLLYYQLIDFNKADHPLFHPLFLS